MKIADAVEKIADGVKCGYKAMETSVVAGYQKIENGAVSGFEKVTDKCVEVLFAREGETAAQAKARLARKEEKDHE